jgi:hypothetical protein
LNRTWGIKWHFISLTSDEMQGMTIAQLNIPGDLAE